MEFTLHKAVNPLQCMELNKKEETDEKNIWNLMKSGI